jgi:hypothetical protein
MFVLGFGACLFVFIMMGRRALNRTPFVRELWHGITRLFKVGLFIFLAGVIVGFLIR